MPRAYSRSLPHIPFPLLQLLPAPFFMLANPSLHTLNSKSSPSLYPNDTITAILLYLCPVQYSAGKGVHLNLKHAEKARVTAAKIPGIVDNLISKTFTWEDERNLPFFYDGVRLISLLEEYKLARHQKDEEKKRFRDQKKLQHLLLTEKEALYGSKSSPKRSISFRKPNGCQTFGNSNGFMTPAPRRISAGCATPELLTPRSYSGRQNGYFKEMRRLSTAPLNFVALSKEDTISSEPGSPPRG